MKKNSAFSLTELAIVITIIGILMAGVSQGTKMVKKSRLAAAQSLTQTSPLSNAEGLVAWFETSVENSFLPTEIEDEGKNISNWFDKNSQAITRNNATQNNNANKPKLYFNVFNGAIPGLRFDGDDFLNFDATTLANNAYTIFIVEQRRTSGSSYFLGGSDITDNANLALGYKNNTTLTQSHYGNDLDIPTPAFVSVSPKIHTFTFDTTNGKKYWLNGGVNPNTTAASQIAALISYNGAAVGKSVNSYYNGDIGEVVVFKRLLSNDERQAIEAYLGKKYSIKTN